MYEAKEPVVGDPAGSAWSFEVAVIIPYYQKQAGILRRSLESVFRQRNAPSVRVIVVDDESPARLEPELGELDPTAYARVQVIIQRNRGPGPARNTALGLVPDTIKYIAFLDSDDVWQDDHLFRAITLLESGFDLFFADGDFEGMSLSYLQRAHFDPLMHECVDRDKLLFAFQGDFLATLLDRSPIVTSTVVMRRDTFGEIRFPASRGLCEDLIYWLSIGLMNPRVCFSTTVEATGGRAGVHLSHAGDWRTNKALSNISGFMDYYNFVLKRVPMAAIERQHVLGRAANNRMDFLMTILAMIKMGKTPDLRLTARFFFVSLTAGFGRVVRLMLCR